MSIPLYTYRYVFVHDEKRSREFRTVRGVVRAGMRELRASGRSYQLDRGDDEEGRLRPFEDMSRRLRGLLRRKLVGDRYLVEALEEDNRVDRARFWVLRTMPKPTVVPGIPAVKQWVGILRANWPKARLAGTCVCKPLDHGDCAAADDFDTDANMQAQRDFLIAHAGELAVKYVILYRSIYSEPGFEPRPHTATYHAHVHVSFNGGISRSACRPSSEWP